MKQKLYLQLVWEFTANYEETWFTNLANTCGEFWALVETLSTTTYSLQMLRNSYIALNFGEVKWRVEETLEG